MNKYIIIIVATVLIIGGGIFYRVFLLPQNSIPVSTGKVFAITVTSEKNKWNFNPDVIEAERGDKVIMTVVNKDDYDHGIAIDAFGVSQRMPANSTIVVEFTVTQEGDFPYYCSVPCGSGEVDGHDRGHFDMTGVIKVRSAKIK
ncbi:MAG: cupredoxin domain-containing protein [Patescibacteria group bacterium]